MKRLNYLSLLWKKLVAAGRRYYTPAELRALGIFLLLGLGIVLFRSGGTIYRNLFPSSDQGSLTHLPNQDSLFHVLIARAEARDSLFFSVPEDSALPRKEARQREHRSKAENLLPHSIALNIASEEQLERLPGVGPATAQAILAYRSERGGFRTIEELRNVRGFGEKHFTEVAPFLRLQ